MPEHHVLSCLEKYTLIIIYHYVCHKQNNKSKKIWLTLRTIMQVHNLHLYFTVHAYQTI